MIRQLVNAKEWISACMYSLSNPVRALITAVQGAVGEAYFVSDYVKRGLTRSVDSTSLHGRHVHHLQQEWKDAALALDEYMQFDEWKVIEEDIYYDWKLVRKVCVDDTIKERGLDCGTGSKVPQGV